MIRNCITVSSIFLFFLLLSPKIISANTQIYSDSFNNSSTLGRQESAPWGSWQVIDGKYRGTAFLNGYPEKPSYSVIGDKSWQNYSLSVDVQGIQGIDKEIAFRINENNQAYIVNLRSEFFAGGDNLVLVKKPLLGSSAGTILTSVPFDNSVGSTYQIKIIAENIVSGVNIKVEVDGTEKINHTDTSNPINNGAVGFEIWPGGYQQPVIGRPTTTDYDNLLVQAFDSTTLVSQNFNIEANPSWNVIKNNCTFLGQSAQWAILDGQIGMKVTGGSCQSFLMSNAIIPVGSDYFVETDIKFSPSIGMDRNLIFKFQDLENWYGLHFFGENGYIEKVVNGTEQILPNRQFNYPFQNGQTYKVKVEAIGNEFKVYINDTLVHTVSDEGQTFAHSKAGLGASAGAVTSSEVWFDNFNVEEINDYIHINVPDLKQSDVPWGNMVYNNYPDTATSQTIRKWGCHLTSASMLLKSHDTDISPLELNTILKNIEGGFDNEHGVNMEAVAGYTKTLGPGKHLEYKYEPFSTEALDIELETGRAVIVKLQGDILPYDTHFVVVYGREDGEYLIRDPEPTFSNTKLSDYSPTLYNHIRKLIPSDSDFSYITIHTDLDVSMKVFDGDGAVVTGYSYIEGPISADDGSTEVSGKPRNVFSYTQPPSDDYRVELSSDTNSNFTLYSYIYDSEANVKLATISGELKNSEPKTVTIDYVKENVDETTITPNWIEEEEVTIDSLLENLADAYQKKFIKRPAYLAIRNSLLTAQRFDLRGAKYLSKLFLKIAYWELESIPQKNINRDFYLQFRQDLLVLIRS